jgi:hypothetical protein
MGRRAGEASRTAVLPAAPAPQMGGEGGKFFSYARGPLWPSASVELPLPTLPRKKRIIAAPQKKKAQPAPQREPVGPVSIHCGNAPLDAQRCQLARHGKAGFVQKAVVLTAVA